MTAEKFRTIGITAKDYAKLVAYKIKTGKPISFVVAQSLELYFAKEEKKK